MSERDNNAMPDLENPDWTDEMFARARPASDLPAEVLSAFRNARRPGRPNKDRTKEAVSIRLDPEIVAYFKMGGPGWQTRINDVLAHHVTVYSRRPAPTARFAQPRGMAGVVPWQAKAKPKVEV